MIGDWHIIWWKELRQRRWSIIAYSLVALAFLALYMVIFPTFQDQTEQLNKLMEAYPKAVLEAFNIDQLQLSTLEGYISAEQFSFIWPIMAIMLALSLAGNAVAGEIEKGTMSIMLSLPISRRKIYLSKYIAGLAIVAIFCLFSSLSIIPLASLTSLSINAIYVLDVTLLCLLFIWSILSLGFMVSSFAREKSNTYFVVGGALLIMYVMNIIGGLIHSLSWIKYGSLFSYFQPANALTNGKVSGLSVLIFMAVAIVATTLGLWRFTRRDISS